MNGQIALAFLLSILPVFELRAGLPLAVEYATRSGLSVWPYFLIVLVLNILAILLAFMFMDFIHVILMRTKLYRKIIGRFLLKTQKKAAKVEKKMDSWGYLALMLFVAIPLPGTGAWTGSIVAWILGLNRKKSFVAIAAGITIAGLIVLLVSLGIFTR